MQPGGFSLASVDAPAPGIVCVWATDAPRIVLIGPEMRCPDNIFFQSDDGAVTINRTSKQDQITIVRRLTGADYVSVTSNPSVGHLVQTLALPTHNQKNPRRVGAGLTFSQIAGLLYKLCQEGTIQAEFLLHRHGLLKPQ